MAQSKEERRQSPQSKEGRRQGGDALSLGMAPAMFNPMMTIFAELNASILEGFAAAQKDWADFVQRRIREDVAVSRQLMNCQSLADVHQIYSQYLRTAFEQYREQSEQVVHRSASMAQYLAETTD
ncbi:MAG: phasin family protein [Hyphomicrobiaceae bacterium]